MCKPISGQDSIVDPVPGWLSGGPSGSSGDGCPNNTTYLALSFTDQLACYTKNEIAINWNAPAVYITGALEYLKLFNNTTVTALDEELYMSEHFSVYPIPASDLINVKINSGQGLGLVKIKILDIQGLEKNSFYVELTSKETIIPVSLNGLADGVYMLEAELGTQKMSHKILLNNK